jgi:zinc protease
VIAGDVRGAETFDRVAELFGEIPAGPAVAPVVAADVPAREERLILEDRVDLTRLYLTWPSPPLFAPGDAELDLAADLLANGRTSRLYRRLVHDRRLATEAVAAQSSRELVGHFQVVVTLAPGQGVDAVRAAVAEEIERLRTDGPGVDELERGRARAEAAFVFRLQSLGGFGGKADQLNAYNVLRGQPDLFDADLARYLSATRESVRDAMRQFIDPARAVELMVVPKT